MYVAHYCGLVLLSLARNFPRARLKFNRAQFFEMVLQLRFEFRLCFYSLDRARGVLEQCDQVVGDAGSHLEELRNKILLGNDD